MYVNDVHTTFRWGVEARVKQNTAKVRSKTFRRRFWSIRFVNSICTGTLCSQTKDRADTLQNEWPLDRGTFF